MNEFKPIESLFDIHLPAPNPIFDKGQLVIDEPVQLKFTIPFDESIHRDYKNQFEDDDRSPTKSLLEYFQNPKINPLYQKFINDPWNVIPLNGQSYASSLFYDTKKLQQQSLQTPLCNQNDLYEMLVRQLPQTQRNINKSRYQAQDSVGYKGLKFNSNFESGNLLAAFAVSEREYDLILQNDTNSKGNTQWFHFSVENTIQGQTVKFNFVNFIKNDSLFNYGQQPVSYSLKQAETQNNLQWQKCGKNLQYYRNQILKERSNSKTYFTLSFTHQFEFSGDTVYFAQCYPYTYSNLIKTIQRYEQDPKVKKLIQVKELCKSIGQMSIPYIIVKNSTVKQNLVIMARQHPGETPGSFMMEGAMEFILGHSFEANLLRSAYNIYMIPMVNPDGVIHGNYRCNLNGLDLNRIWHCPHRELHDSVYHIRALVRGLNKEGGVSLILDLHGHSKKFNSFFYGNPTNDQISTRLLPKVAALINKSISIHDCSFTISENKRNTARVALQSEIVGQCYTFETSFHGHELAGQSGTVAYTIESYKVLGRDIILAYFLITKQLYHKQNLDVFGLLPFTFMKDKTQEIENYIREINKKDDVYKPECELDSSGSESNPEADSLIEGETLSIQLKYKSLDDSPIQIRNQTSIRRRIRQQPLSKYTQTEQSIFSGLMRDPQILNYVKLQLMDSKDDDDSSGQINNPQQSKHKIFDEEIKPDNPTFPINHILPIRIYSLKFKSRTQRAIKGSQKGNNLQLNVPLSQSFNTQYCGVQCQTMISLQLILGNYETNQIESEQSPIRRQSQTLREQVSIEKKIKATNIMIATPKPGWYSSPSNDTKKKSSSQAQQQRLIHITSLSYNKESTIKYTKNKSFNDLNSLTINSIQYGPLIETPKPQQSFFTSGGFAGKRNQMLKINNFDQIFNSVNVNQHIRTGRQKNYDLSYSSNKR